MEPIPLEKRIRIIEFSWMGEDRLAKFQWRLEILDKYGKWVEVKVIREKGDPNAARSSSNSGS